MGLPGPPGKAGETGPRVCTIDVCSNRNVYDWPSLFHVCCSLSCHEGFFPGFPSSSRKIYK